MEKIMTLYINCKEFLEVKNDELTMLQIIFDGTVEGEWFNGTVMNGGVDTQTINPDGSGTLSARYCLEGTDREGLSCRMYISNDAELGSEKTFPKIHSDSPSLKWLSSARLEGKMINDDEGLRIEFYALTN